MSEKERVASWLNSLTDKEFFAFFYELAPRNLHPLEKEYSHNHFVLANASRLLGNDGQWGPWELELLCPTPGQTYWGTDAPVCQSGEHCGHTTVSWAKSAICPICGGHVYGT